MNAAGFAELLGLTSSAARRWIGAVAIASAGMAVPAAAQDTAVFLPGYAVVTGFSGTVSGEVPDGEDPTDYLTLDYSGASANVIDLSVMGEQGALTEAPKVLSISAADVGQVFGVTLDDAPAPNIYLSASSAYGLSIYLADDSGQIKRLKTGEPGAAFVPGQFGPEDQGGSPGSIWRVDGVSGEVSLFASIASAEMGVASLGGLAFDPASRQILAVDRGTGIIYRFSLNGTERGTYDHGVEGRPGAGLSPAPQPPSVPLNISSPAFNTENPATWRYAPISRRTFGIAVRNKRAYYSVAQGPQVWSVAISPTGAIGGSPRIETSVPGLQPGVEIASIAFDAQGRMYLAERGAPTGDYALTALARDDASRVLRYIPKPAGDPSPGFWLPDPEQYAISMPAPYNNAQGGVALGYGYDQQGTLDPSQCRATVWATGERMLDPGDPSTPPDSYPLADGIQGTAIDMVMPENTPPFYSWFVDYDDEAGTPEARGQVGAVVTLAPCGGQPKPPAPPPPPPPSWDCPPGTYFDNGQCQIIPTCPPGTEFYEGSCYYPTCPPGYVEWQGECVPPPQSCPPGMFFYKGDCVPIGCPPGMFMKKNGSCGCKPGDIFFQGQCKPPSFCPPWMIQLPGGICWCPLGTKPDKGMCKPICDKDEMLIGGQCVPKFCKPFEIKLPNGKCVKPCKPGWKMLPNGQCVPDNFGPNCPPKHKWLNGDCVPICKPFEKLINGKCEEFPIGPKPGNCAPNEKWINGKCIDFPIGPKPKLCKPNEKWINGKCIDLPIGPKPGPGSCGPNEKWINGKCIDLPIGPKPGPGNCGPGEKFINGKCLDLPIGPKPPKCKPWQKLVDGECVGLPPKPIDNQKPKLPKGPDIIKQPDVQNCGPNEAFINGQCRLKKLPRLDGPKIEKQKIEQPKVELRNKDNGNNQNNNNNNNNNNNKPKFEKPKRGPVECPDGQVFKRGECRPEG